MFFLLPTSLVIRAFLVEGLILVVTYKLWTKKSLLRSGITGLLFTVLVIIVAHVSILTISYFNFYYIQKAGLILEGVLAGLASYATLRGQDDDPATLSLKVGVTAMVALLVINMILSITLSPY